MAVDDITYGYDTKGRITGVDYPVGYTYDTQGRRTNITVDGWDYASSFDGFDYAPKSITRPNGSVTAYTYDEKGGVLSFELPFSGS